mmetsp:Transcript_25895/g.45752  ORF Transcript_25895/g.45752 Transcript_25895/m.45752 type:complete len:275 (-) Transcript_25895:5454-6278(-)
MEDIRLPLMDDCLYSGQVELGSHSFTLKIKSDRLCYSQFRSDSKPSHEFELPWRDILGAVNSTGEAFKVLTFPKRGSSREFRVLEFRSSKASYWIASIQSVMLRGRLPKIGEDVPRKKFIIVINPVSGRGIAMRNWRRVEAMFGACFIDVIETQYPGHAGEIALEIEPESIDALLLVSGDGLVFEVVNAICKADKRALVISAVPGGSANAFAYELCHESGEEYSLETCAFIAQKGQPSPLDITKLELLNEKKTIYSFLMFAWTIIADIDIESEM